MSAQTVIDSLEFARTEQTLRGGLPIADLARLRDDLYDALGVVDFVVRGGHDARHRPTLGLEVSGLLHLRCQRCLGCLEHLFQLASSLLLAEPGAAESVALDDEESDWIEASAQLDVAALVEDEIILALPYSPRHPEGECRAATGPAPPTGQEKQSAFAKLATLKRDST
jgi:uncharacterized protein